MHIQIFDSKHQHQLHGTANTCKKLQQNPAKTVLLLLQTLQACIESTQELTCIPYNNYIPCSVVILYIFFALLSMPQAGHFVRSTMRGVDKMKLTTRILRRKKTYRREVGHSFFDITLMGKKGNVNKKEVKCYPTLCC